jgi:hypothetical protein
MRTISIVRSRSIVAFWIAPSRAIVAVWMILFASVCELARP